MIVEGPVGWVLAAWGAVSLLWALYILLTGGPS